MLKVNALLFAMSRVLLIIESCSVVFKVFIGAFQIIMPTQKDLIIKINK